MNRRRRAPIPTPKEVAERAAVRAKNWVDAHPQAEPGVTPDRKHPQAPPGRTPDRSVAAVEREYRVIGPRLVAGKRRGETLSMSERQAATLIEAGHIEPVVNNKAAMERPKMKGASHG